MSKQFYIRFLLTLFTSLVSIMAVLQAVSPHSPSETPAQFDRADVSGAFILTDQHGQKREWREFASSRLR